MSPTPTAGQTVGPFFGYALPFPHDNELVAPGSPGSIILRGAVRDGAGGPVPDAILELWQADAAGDVVQQQGTLRRDHSSGVFTGFGRASTGTDGGYSFTTLVPGAPFFAVTVVARGLLNRLFTRAYLPGSTDAFLDRLDPERRSTLMTTRDETGLVFDIHLQGERETVFLTYPRQPGQPA
jgi:protocatechuate 3,4-dioxygenase, alpha subunit